MSSKVGFQVMGRPAGRGGGGEIVSERGRCGAAGKEEWKLVCAEESGKVPPVVVWRLGLEWGIGSGQAKACEDVAGGWEH